MSSLNSMNYTKSNRYLFRCIVVKTYLVRLINLSVTTTNSYKSVTTNINKCLDNLF